MRTVQRSPLVTTCHLHAVRCTVLIQYCVTVCTLSLSFNSIHIFCFSTCRYLQTGLSGLSSLKSYSMVKVSAVFFYFYKLFVSRTKYSVLFECPAKWVKINFKCMRFLTHINIFFSINFGYQEHCSQQAATKTA